MSVKNIVTKKKTEVVASVDTFAQDAGIGQENMAADDFAIPRLVILQALSPQLHKNKSEYLEGAKAGDIMDTVSFKLYDGESGITLLPISYRRAYIEWKLRSEGGGFVADHGSDGSVLNLCKRDENFRDITKDGTQIVTTAEYFAYIVDKITGLFNPVILSMASTQMKKARRWNTLINQFQMKNASGATFNPPMFSRLYKLTTQVESNDLGSWFGWGITADDIISDVDGGMDIYKAAKAFRDKVVAGEVKVSPQVEYPPNEETADDPL